MEPPARCRMHLLIPARPPRRRGPALPSRRPESSVVRRAGEATAVDVPSGTHACRGVVAVGAPPPALLAADLSPAPLRSRPRAPLPRSPHCPRAPLAKCIGGERRCIFTSPLSSKGKLHRELPRLLERASVVHSTNRRGKNGFASGSAVGVSLAAEATPFVGAISLYS
jgi:hypothetical protein